MQTFSEGHLTNTVRRRGAVCRVRCNGEPFLPEPEPCVSGLGSAQRLTMPANVRLVCLPPYCPELSPIERVWRDLKDDLAWHQFLSVDAQQDDVAQLLRACDVPTLQALTGYAYSVDAINALVS